MAKVRAATIAVVAKLNFMMTEEAKSLLEFEDFDDGSLSVNSSEKCRRDLVVLHWKLTEAFYTNFRPQFLRRNWEQALLSGKDFT